MAIAAAVAMFMGMLVRVTVFLGMIMRMTVAVIAFTTIRQMHIKFYPINRAFLPAIGAERVALELEFLQFLFQRIKIHAQIDHRAQKHVAADAAEDVEVKGFHLWNTNFHDGLNVLNVLKVDEKCRRVKCDRRKVGSPVTAEARVSP